MLHRCVATVTDVQLPTRLCYTRLKFVLRHHTHSLINVIARKPVWIVLNDQISWQSEQPLTCTYVSLFLVVATELSGDVIWPAECLWSLFESAMNKSTDSWTHSDFFFFKCLFLLSTSQNKTHDWMGDGGSSSQVCETSPQLAQKRGRCAFPLPQRGFISQVSMEKPHSWSTIFLFKLFTQNV